MGGLLAIEIKEIGVQSRAVLCPVHTSALCRTLLGRPTPTVRPLRDLSMK